MRALVALLLLANLGFLALAQGWLQPWAGLSTAHEREPQRLAAQIEADAVRVLDARATAAVLAASAPGCLLAGPLAGVQLAAAEAALAPLAVPPARRASAPADAAAAANQAWLRFDTADAGQRERVRQWAAAQPGLALRPCP
jgi:hypothetical protein